MLENSYFLQFSEPKEQPQTEKLPVLSMHQAREKIIKIKIGGEKFSTVKQVGVLEKLGPGLNLE